MKYKVIGWTEYDNSLVPEGEVSNAVINAIIDCIKENKFLFTGFDHQERLRCAPVLNDGKKRLFSQRSFGGIMAIANGYMGHMDYSMFAFDWDDDDLDENRKIPSSEFAYKYTFVPEQNLSQEYIVEVDSQVFENAKLNESIELEETDYLRFLDTGDTLTLSNDTNKEIYIGSAQRLGDRVKPGRHEIPNWNKFMFEIIHPEL